MEDTEDRGIHWCPGCAEFSEEHAPYFYHADAEDTVTGIDFKMVLMRFMFPYGPAVIQVQYCPFCGAYLSTPEWDWRARRNQIKDNADRAAAYREYRKRVVRAGVPAEPMSAVEYHKANDEYKEVELLLPHARPEHIDTLFKRKQELRDLLRINYKAPKIKVVTAEEFAQFMHNTLIDNTPDFLQESGQT